MPRCWPHSREALWQTPSHQRAKHEANVYSVDQAGHWAKECPYQDKLQAANAISWDIGWHSVLRTQEPQGQAPSLPHDGSTGLKWPTPANPPVADSHREAGVKSETGCGRQIREFLGSHRGYLLFGDLLVRIGKRSPKWQWLKDKEGKSLPKQNKGRSEDQSEDLR